MFFRGGIWTLECHSVMDFNDMMVHEFSIVSEGDQGRTFSFILVAETFRMSLLII